MITIYTKDHFKVLPRHDSCQEKVMSLKRESFLVLKYILYKVDKSQLDTLIFFCFFFHLPICSILSLQFTRHLWNKDFCLVFLDIHMVCIGRLIGEIPAESLSTFFFLYFLISIFFFSCFRYLCSSTYCDNCLSHHKIWFVFLSPDFITLEFSDILIKVL